MPPVKGSSSAGFRGLDARLARRGYPPAAVLAVGGDPTPPARSSTLEVRNPVLALPSVAAIRALPLECRAPMADLLREVAADADAKAEAAWRRRKGPMAAYWRAVSTYAKHTARAIVSADERRRARAKGGA